MYGLSIPRHEILTLNPLPMVGQTVNFNHDDCGDSRGRLRVTGKPDGSYAAFCHNCNAKGIAVPEWRSRVVRPAPVQQEGKHIPHPEQVVEDLRAFPKEGRLWLLSAGITSEDVRENKIVYNPASERILLPGFWEGKMRLRQDRRLSGDGPKYLTYHDGTPWGKAFYARSFEQVTDTVVIVEDILSAIRVAKLPKTTAVACMSSGLMQFHVNHVASRGFRRILIYLDNDTAEVLRSVRVMQRKFSLLCKAEIGIITADRDPKEHHTRELMQLLWG